MQASHGGDGIMGLKGRHRYRRMPRCRAWNWASPCDPYAGDDVGVPAGFLVDGGCDEGDGEAADAGCFLKLWEVGLDGVAAVADAGDGCCGGGGGVLVAVAAVAATTGVQALAPAPPPITRRRRG